MFVRLAVVLFVCFSSVGSAYAACKTQACREATAWKVGYTAVVLDDDISAADYRAALDAITKNGGVVAIEAERVILGWIPQSVAGEVRQTRGVTAVLYDRVARPSDLVRRPDALSALGFFNDVRTGAYEDQIEISLAAPGRPLAGDVLIDSASRSRQLETSSATSTGRTKLRFQSDSYANPGLSSAMNGRVTVQLFRVDSNGAIDSNTYSWTDSDMTTVNNQAMGAFTFWVSQATSRGVTPALSFRPIFMDPISHYNRKRYPAATKYEPVTRPHTDDYLWVNDALWYVGYSVTTPTPSNVRAQVDAFNAAQLNDPYTGAYDRSFSVFIAYNQGDPNNGYFADGYGGAYAYFGGPHSIMLTNSSGWGIFGFGTVLSHETGHIFWACDEYAAACASCSYCESSTLAPRNTVSTPWVTNSNCENPQAACSTSVNCMMKNSTAALCPHTPAQIGW